LKKQRVRADDRGDGVLRIERADCDGLRTGMSAAAHVHQQGAVVLAVAAAADGKPGIGVLGESKRRRDDRKTDGCEQDEAEKATHEFRPDGHSLRVSKVKNKRSEPKIG
jgi:hypothetical protein